MKPIIDLASKARLQQMDKDEIIALYLKQTREFQSAFDSLIEKIALANTRHFGSSSEHLIPEQISLFNDMEAAYVEETPEPRVGFEKGRKKSRKRDIDLSKLPSVTIEHELPQEEQVCPACEGMLTDIKVETTYQLVYVPARFEVEKHNRHVYVCKSCSKRNESGEDTSVPFLRAPMPGFPIAKSIASPSLLAFILDAKYVNSLPLYRIEADLKRNTSVKIARRNMANWTLRVADDYLHPLYEAMREELLTKGVRLRFRVD